MDLPPRPRFRGNRKRRALCDVAWRITETLVAYCTFVECGSPKRLATLDHKLGTRVNISPQQRRACFSLYRDVLESAAVEPLVGPKTRGLNSLQTQLSALLAEQTANPGGQSFVDKVEAAASPVHHLRISVPPNVASIDPSSHLTNIECQQFLYHSARVLDPAPPASDHPKPCYMASEREEPVLRQWLIQHKIAFPIPEDKIARRSDGRLLLSGLLAVPHKTTSDRLIVDRRPLNFGENQFKWCHLPLGPQLSRLELKDDEEFMISADDLASYFHQLKQAPHMHSRAALGRRFFVDGIPCRLCINTIPMGDTNAVDVAQQVHVRLLESVGNMSDDVRIEYGRLLPTGTHLEGI